MSSLSPNATYVELVSVRLVGMMLTIIVRQELRKNVVRYSTQAVGTGALNFMVSSFFLFCSIPCSVNVYSIRFHSRNVKDCCFILNSI